MIENGNKSEPEILSQLWNKLEMMDRAIQDNVARDMMLYIPTRIMIDMGNTPPMDENTLKDYNRIHDRFHHIYDEIIGDSIKKRLKNI